MLAALSHRIEDIELLVITHQHIDAGIIVGIIAPLGSALGIRQFVTPTKETPADAGQRPSA